jgi:hypothetical protein
MSMEKHPKGSQVNMVVNIRDATKAEQEILCQLNKYGTITQRKDIGRKLEQVADYCYWICNNSAFE